MLTDRKATTIEKRRDTRAMHRRHHARGVPFDVLIALIFSVGSGNLARAVEMSGLAKMVGDIRHRNVKRSAVYCSAVVVGYSVSILLSATLGEMAHGSYFWLAYGAAIVFIGTRLRGIRNIVHECAHYAFAETRAANDAFGHALSVLTLSSFVAYRREHLSHHRSLGSYELDLDFARLKHFDFHEELTFRRLLRHILLPLTLVNVPTYVSVTLVHPEDPRLVNAARYSYAVLLGVFAVVSPYFFCYYALVPFLIVHPALNYWTDCVDHGGILKARGALDQSRNFILPRLLRWIFFPRNDHWHLIHHLMPFVAVRHFEDAHQLLLAHYPGYANLRHHVRDKVAWLIGERRSRTELQTAAPSPGNYAKGEE